MNEPVYEYLKSVARNRSVTTYAEAGKSANLNMDNPADRQRISQILEEIAQAENKAGRPMLTAVVVLAGDGYPSSGFFDVAKRLGKYSGGDALTFYAEELRRVHDFWQKQQ